MYIFCKIIIEFVFFIIFFGWYIPYCFNQFSDLWFLIGVISILVFVPLEIYRFVNFIFNYFKTNRGE